MSTRLRAACCILVVALPIAVQRTSSERDTSETVVSVAGGVGQYALVTRGCEGEVLSSQPIPFRDGAVSVEHHFAGPLALGVRAGTIDHRVSGRTFSLSYVNPHASLEWPLAGIGGGYLHASDPFPFPEYESHDVRFSAHGRLGSRDERYAFVRYMESEPLYSGGGYGELGLGYRISPRVEVSVGLSAFPYDGAGTSIGARLEVAPGTDLDLHARLGIAGGEPELAAAVGVSRRLGWRRTARAEAARPSTMPSDSLAGSPP